MQLQVMYGAHVNGISLSGKHHDWELGIVADFYQALEGLKGPNDNEDIVIREGTNKKVLPVKEAYAYYSNIGQ